MFSSYIYVYCLPECYIYMYKLYDQDNIRNVWPYKYDL